MSATITIEIDDAGRPTVSVDGKEAYQCESIDECLEYLRDMLKGEEANEPGQEAEPSEPSGDMAAMWDEEAAKRPPQPGLMR